MNINPVGTCPDDEHSVYECAIYFIGALKGTYQFSESAFSFNSCMSHSQKMKAGRRFLSSREYLIVLEEI
ncbi:MAG: hypothetical protein AAF502_18880 [Bacteroidota bacterium]